MVHPVITLLRTATGATSLPHRRREKSGQWTTPAPSPVPFIPAILAGALSFGSDRQVYTRSILSPSRCTTTCCSRTYFRIVNFCAGVKGGFGSCAAVSYTSNVEEAVTRRVISEQLVAPSNLPYWPALAREKEIR